MTIITDTFDFCNRCSVSSLTSSRRLKSKLEKGSSNKSKSGCVIIVTHDPIEAMFISNHINIFDKSGSIVQSGTPNDLYNNPKNSYVTGFFGETNKFEGVVKESHIYTPVGKIKTPGNLEGEKVVVHIRPQGIKLNKQPTPVNGIKGTVMASKLMGSFSFIHLSVLDNNNEVVHVHSHMPADFNPKQSSAVEIEIDNDQAYIFKN